MYIFKYLLDIPKTIWFNFKVMPFRDAIKLPFFVSHNYKIRLPKNAKKIFVFEKEISRFCVRFVNGGSEDIIPNKYGLISLSENSRIVFRGNAKFGAGCCIKIINGGELIFGNNFSANRNCSITSCNSIEFGDDCILAFEIIIRDLDGHVIKKDKIQKLESAKVKIGNHVWICGRCAILKGTIVGDDAIVAFGSIVNKCFMKNNIIIAGAPATIASCNVEWIF